MRGKGLSLALILGLVVMVSCSQKQETQQAPAATKTFTVTVLNDSTVSVEGHTVPLDSLAVVLKAKGCDSTAVVTLQPAANVPMGTIDSVHAILRQLGVEKITNKSPAS